MPTYQYSCTECGHFLEVVQAFTDDSLTECPECGGRLRKVFGAVGVVFKGSGFYRTDSRSGSGSDTSSTKGDSSSSGSGSESKPAAAKTESSSSSSSTSGSASSASSSGGSSSSSSPKSA